MTDGAVIKPRIGRSHKPSCSCPACRPDVEDDPAGNEKNADLARELTAARDHRNFDWAKFHAWSPVYQHNVSVDLIKQLEALYRQENNPIFVWEARVFAKLLAPDDREPVRWIEEYLDKVGDRLVASRAPKSAINLADGIVAALGFKHFEPGSKWPASLAATAMRHEWMAVRVWRQLAASRPLSEERATEIVAMELGVSHRAVKSAWRAFKKGERKKNNVNWFNDFAVIPRN